MSVGAPRESVGERESQILGDGQIVFGKANDQEVHVSGHFAPPVKCVYVYSVK